MTGGDISTETFLGDGGSTGLEGWGGLYAGDGGTEI